MLKTNSAKARENLRRYIMDGYTPEGYTDNPPQDWPGIAAHILTTFRDEKPREGRFALMSGPALFEDWAQGLPSILDTCYYYNRSAVADLAAILEETEKEAAYYSESDSETLLTQLIYRELCKGEAKHSANATAC